MWIGVDAKQEILWMHLAGVTDPEAEAKAIGNAFIEVFEKNQINFRRSKMAGTRNESTQNVDRIDLL